MLIETLAFTLLIGGQFLAAVYLMAHRAELYSIAAPVQDEAVAVRTIEATQS